MSDYTDELVLTNLQLIHVEHGIFGKVKGMRKIPLNHIRVAGNRAQVICGKNPEDGAYELQIFMKNGEQDAFQFRGRKRTINEWVNEICLAATGVVPEPRGETTIMDGLKGMAISAIKDALNIEDAPAPTRAPVPEASFTPVEKEKTTNQCIGCGAPLTGYVGDVIRCEYCDILQKLQ